MSLAMYFMAPTYLSVLKRGRSECLPIPARTMMVSPEEMKAVNPNEQFAVKESEQCKHEQRAAMWSEMNVDDNLKSVGAIHGS